MKTEQYPAKILQELLQQQQIASMQQMKEALGTRADITVVRKLAELSYLSSYSHRGKYYTVASIPGFDEWGLWSFRSVWFSKRGTLLNTAAAVVDESAMGFYSDELENLLHVDVRKCLLQLTQRERVVRKKLFGRYLYCSVSSSKRKEQLRARKVEQSESSFGGPRLEAELMPDELKAAIVLFFALLDEKQRRLYAGLESLKLGYGGDQRIAGLLGLDRGTVARGREELLAQDVEVERVRTRGGGRKPLGKKRRK